MRSVVVRCRSGVDMQTYGCDYGYGVSIAKINQALATNLANVKMPVVFSTVDPDSGTTINLNAVLAPWQIATGGQPTLLHLTIPFSDGYLELAGGALKNGSYDVSDVSALLEVQLGWVGPGTEQQAQGSGNVTQLSFDPSSTDPNNPGYVATIRIDDPDGNLDTISTALLKAYLANALITNKANLQYILANTNPRPENLASWLQPTAWQYFYADSIEALCFLCMMSSAPIPQGASFDTSAFVAGVDCALLVAQPQFFVHVVLPGIQAAFPGGSFSVSTTAEISTVSNNGDFDLGSVTASTLTVTTSDAGNGLKVYADGGGPLKFLFGLADLPGASYSWNVTSTNPQVYAAGKLSFATDPNPVINQDHTIHWYDWALLVVVGITDTAGLVSAIYDSVKGFHNEVQEVGIGTINTEAQSATGGTVVNLQNVVDWKLGQQQLSVTAAGLDGPLYVQGNFS